MVILEAILPVAVHGVGKEEPFEAPVGGVTIGPFSSLGGPLFGVVQKNRPSDR